MFDEIFTIEAEGRDDLRMVFEPVDRRLGDWFAQQNEWLLGVHMCVDDRFAG